MVRSRPLENTAAEEINYVISNNQCGYADALRPIRWSVPQQLYQMHIERKIHISKSLCHERSHDFKSGAGLKRRKEHR